MLDSKTKQLIHDMTADIHKLFEIQTPITDMDEIIKKLSGTIEYKNNIGYETSVQRTNDAEKEHAFKIQIPADTDKIRAKFKIAQMIGELFLDMGFLVDNKRYNSLPLNTKNNPSIEYGYVNYFACAFLMPKDEYLDQIKKHTVDNKVNTSAIADHFAVDVNTASLYGVLLGVLRNF